MPYPNSLDAFTDPVGSQALSVVPHSSIEIAQNAALRALESYLGITSSAVASSVSYQVQSTSSIDPGHKHTSASIVGGGGFVPTGALIQYASSAATASAVAAPANYLLPQGQAISRTIYATLFGILGTLYGAGDGSTTFNVPNLMLANAVDFGSTNTNKSLNYTSGTINSSSLSRYSFSMWVKLDTEITSGTYGLMSWNGMTTNQSLDLYYEYNSGSIQLHLRRAINTVSNNDVYIVGALGTTQWHHIQGGIDGTNLYLFLDGQQYPSTSLSGSGGSSVSGGFCLGSERVYTTGTIQNPASARFADVFLSGRFLGAGEAYNSYKNPGSIGPTEPNLVAMYKFTTLTTDISGNGKTLTNTNAANQVVDFPYSYTIPILKT